MSAPASRAGKGASGVGQYASGAGAADGLAGAADVVGGGGPAEKRPRVESVCRGLPGKTCRRPPGDSCMVVDKAHHSNGKALVKSIPYCTECYCKSAKDSIAGAMRSMATTSPGRPKAWYAKAALSIASASSHLVTAALP